MRLPAASDRVRLEIVHPRLLERAGALLEDKRVRGRYTVVSGGRLRGAPGDIDRADALSIGTGWYFWEGYQRKLAGQPGYSHFNLAANPKKKWGSGSDSGIGSKHCQQNTPEGLYGLALDIRLSDGLVWPKVHQWAGEYGLLFPLADKAKFGKWAEPWHMTGTVAQSVSRWAKPEKKVWAPWSTWGIRFDTVQHTPKPSRYEQVKHAQKILGNLVVDGIVGPATTDRAQRCRNAAKVILG